MRTRAPNVDASVSIPERINDASVLPELRVEPTFESLLLLAWTPSFDPMAFPGSDVFVKLRSGQFFRQGRGRY